MTKKVVIKKTDHEYLLKEFQTATDTALFYELAEEIIRSVDDPKILIEYGILASKRMPGGAYYAIKFWSSFTDSLGDDPTEATLLAKTSEISKSYKLPFAKVKKQILKNLLFKKASKETEDLEALREAPFELFEKAYKQKQKGVEYLVSAARHLRQNPEATLTQVHQLWCTKNGSTKSNLDIIKPSDWWAFSHPKWKQEDDFQGSIPGEIYANALYYFSPTEGIAVDAMAGSGMLKRVYDDRHRWQRDLPFNLDIHLFDLYPRRDYICEHDATTPLPIKADWIFIDPPYFGQSAHLFKGTLASTSNYDEYLSILQKIIIAMSRSLNPNGRLCIFLPKWSGLNLDDLNHDAPSDTHAIAIDAGLKWIDAAYVSRGRQQENGSAIKNNMAKRERRMRSDTCVLNVFENKGV